MGGWMGVVGGQRRKEEGVNESEERVYLEEVRAGVSRRQWGWAEGWIC